MYGLSVLGTCYLQENFIFNYLIPSRLNKVGTAENILFREKQPAALQKCECQV
jgi:hypothetical protein